MYVFGFDLPLPEMLLISMLIIVALVVLLIVIIVKIVKMGNTLDTVLDEEKIVRKGMDNLREEENKQLDYIRSKIKKIDEISDQETQQLKELGRLVRLMRN